MKAKLLDFALDEKRIASRGRSMRMEMALKMEMMSMIINHGSANIQTRVHAVRVMQI